MKCKKITAKSFKKISVSSYKSKNVTIRGQPKTQSRTIRVGENAKIIGQLGTFETNISLLSNVWEVTFPTILY